MQMHQLVIGFLASSQRSNYFFVCLFVCLFHMQEEEEAVDATNSNQQQDSYQ